MYRRLVIVLAFFLVGAAGSFLAARTVTPAPACASGNKGELVVDSTVLKYCNGTSFVTIDAAPSLQDGGLIFPDPLSTRTWGYCNNDRNTILLCADSIEQWAAAGCAAIDVATDANYAFWKCACKNPGTTATYVSSAVYPTAHRPRLIADVLEYDVTANTARECFGFYETSSAACSVVPSLTPTASTEDYVGIAKDVTVSPNWMCCSGDGTNHSCLDMGLAVTLGLHMLDVDWSTLGTLTCSITDNGVTTTINKSTNLSTTSTALHGTAREACLASDAGNQAFAVTQIWAEVE